MTKPNKREIRLIHPLIDFVNLHFNRYSLLRFHIKHQLGFYWGDYCAGNKEILCISRNIEKFVFFLTNGELARKSYAESPDYYIPLYDKRIAHLFEILKIRQKKYQIFFDELINNGKLDFNFRDEILHIFGNTRKTIIPRLDRKKIKKLSTDEAREALGAASIREDLFDVWGPHHYPDPEGINLETVLDVSIGWLFESGSAKKVFMLIKKCTVCEEYFIAEKDRKRTVCYPPKECEKLRDRVYHRSYSKEFMRKKRNPDSPDYDSKYIS